MSNLPNTRPITSRRSRFTNKRWLVAAALLGALLGLWLSPGRGYAAEAPVGGCKEAPQVMEIPSALTSPGARYCRDHGWILRAHVVVTPFGVATTDLPRCANEDSIRCYWNSLRRGNHEGNGFISLPGRLIRVDRINGHLATSNPVGYWTVLPDGV